MVTRKKHDKKKDTSRNESSNTYTEFPITALLPLSILECLYTARTRVSLRCPFMLGVLRRPSVRGVLSGRGCVRRTGGREDATRSRRDILRMVVHTLIRVLSGDPLRMSEIEISRIVIGWSHEDCLGIGVRKGGILHMGVCTARDRHGRPNGR
jgi:hypothetical protein